MSASFDGSDGKMSAALASSIPARWRSATFVGSPLTK
jgi:hypothetical protein